MILSHTPDIRCSCVVAASNTFLLSLWKKARIFVVNLFSLNHTLIVSAITQLFNNNIAPEKRNDFLFSFLSPLIILSLFFFFANLVMHSSFIRLVTVLIILFTPTDQRVNNKSLLYYGSSYYSFPFCFRCGYLPILVDDFKLKSGK